MTLLIAVAITILTYRVYLNYSARMTRRTKLTKLSKNTRVNMGPKLIVSEIIIGLVEKHIEGPNREHQIVRKRFSETNRCVKQKSQGIKYYVPLREVFHRDITVKRADKVTLQFLNRDLHFLFQFLKPTFRRLQTNSSRKSISSY